MNNLASMYAINIKLKYHAQLFGCTNKLNTSKKLKVEIVNVYRNNTKLCYC